MWARKDYGMRSLSGLTAGMRPRARRWMFLVLLVVAASACIAGVGCSTGSSIAGQSLVKSINAFVPASGSADLTLFAGGVYLAQPNLTFGQVGENGSFVTLTSGTYNLV